MQAVAQRHKHALGACERAASVLPMQRLKLLQRKFAYHPSKADVDKPIPLFIDVKLFWVI